MGCARRIFRQVVLQWGQVTGAPIYLVSACATGEEFVAAFRRYADKNGLFVPIGEPLSTGGRARFAVTLHDGGVMIEGLAEVVSSARTASVLHGRVGMTLRFIEPDAASKITLAELEKARLSMRPAPPSIAPRPATLPAQPRSVPPAPQGRIDAINALAECVAIGEPAALEALGSAAPSSVAAPPKAGPRFVVPVVPPRSAAPTPIPQPVVPARSAGRRADPAEMVAAASVAAYSRTMTAVPPTLEPGPSSDTLIAVVPPGAAPAEPSAPPEVPSAPPAPPLDAPPPPVMAAASPPHEPASPAPRRATEMPIAIPRTATKPGPATAPIMAPRAITPATGSAATPAPRAPITATRAVPPPPASSASMSAVPTALPQSGPTDTSGRTVDPGSSDAAIVITTTAPARDDLSARTQVHAGAPRPTATATTAAPPAIATSPVEDDVEIEDDVEVDVELAEPTDFSIPSADDAAAPASQPRKTVLGIAVAPADLTDALDETTDSSSLTGHESTGPDGVSLDDPGADPGSPANEDEPPLTALDEQTPLEIWRLPPGAAVPSSAGGMRYSMATSPGVAPAASPPPGGRSTAATPGGVLPSGDWTIALDPAAPDGWSASFPTTTDSDATEDPEPAIAGAAPASSRAELPVAEPKVQIDPTLIEPVPASLPSQPYPVAVTASRGLAYGSIAGEPPAGSVMTTPPHPGMFVTPYGAPAMHASEAPAYAMSPGYQMVPVASALASGVAPHRSFGDPHPADETLLRARSGRRRAIIVIISAAVAVAVGIALVAALTGSRDPEPARGAVPPRESSPAAPAGGAPPAPGAAPGPPASQVPGGHAAATAAPPVTVANHATPADAAACFADVSSVPTGAEIVIDQTTVIGTTPQTVALPCGAEVELVVRKARLLPVSRTVTPTPAGVKVRVALAKQSFLVKVSSKPEGATIMLNGKPLGVTPTTVKVPAFESSTLIIAKAGYETEAEKIAPKASDTSVRVQLRRLDRTR